MSKINKELILRKINFITRDLKELERFQNYSFKEIAKDYDKHKVIERIIEVIINEALDINQHIIAESYLGEAPFDYKQSFLKLVELDILPEKFAEEIAKSVGLRNILVHRYHELDEKMFYQSIKNCLQQYKQYCEYVFSFLES